MGTEVKTMTIRQRYAKSLASGAKNGRADWRTDRALVGHGICPFCGKKVDEKTQTYCYDCRTQGFDEVHKMFGSSNGWDKRPTRVIPVRNGWRGRRVTGANARRQFSD